MVERNDFSSQDTTPIDYSLIASGDELEWERLFTKEWNGLVRFNASRPNTTFEDAEDAAMEALIGLWINKDRIDYRLGAKAYLLTSARHRKIDLERKMGRRKETPLSPETEHFLKDTNTLTNPDEVVLTNETNREVHQVLDMLPPDQKAALVVAYIEEAPQSQAIKTLGIPLGTYKSKCHRGRNKFARIWETLSNR